MHNTSIGMLGILLCYYQLKTSDPPPFIKYSVSILFRNVNCFLTMGDCDSILIGLWILFITEKVKTIDTLFSLCYSKITNRQISGKMVTNHIYFGFIFDKSIFGISGIRINECALKLGNRRVLD